MKMLRNDLLIRILPRQQTGCIKLPENYQDDFLRGKVVTTGPGIFDNGCYEPMQCKEGDTVVFSAHPGAPGRGQSYAKITIADEDYVIIPEHFICGIE